MIMQPGHIGTQQRRLQGHEQFDFGVHSEQRPQSMLLPPCNRGAVSKDLLHGCFAWHDGRMNPSYLHLW